MQYVALLLTISPNRSNQDISNQAVTEISNRLLYDIENNRAPYKNGPLDIQLVHNPTKTANISVLC